jgi:gas vesicle protein
MSRFLQGLFTGISISLIATLIIALMKSEMLRRQLGKRFEELRNALPESEQLKQSAQQTATKVRKTKSVLGNLIQQSVSGVMQRRQEGISTVQQTAQSMEQSELN